MTKIIGFLITKKNKKPKVDFFDVGIKTISIKHNGYNIYLWGIGNIENYKINSKYSLSFPLTDSLFDRNVLISFVDDKIIVENDWLGSIPVFYNEKEHIVSTLPNLCLKDKNVNEEGLSYFCEFGYSVFEKTIFEDVKFMRYYSKLIISSNNIEIEYKNDSVLDKAFLEYSSTEEEVIDSMQEYISNIESKIDGEIVLPTSGGYDSRILNYFIKDKSRIRAFTYGISSDQSKSFEVVYAKQISKIYGIKWEQIELKEFHKYIDEWFNIYGFSTHLHGMYHIEFYKNITKKYDFSNSSFLSGVFGDIWAGSIEYKEIRGEQDVINLGYTHGMSLDLKYLKINSNNKEKKKFFTNIKGYIHDDRIKAVFTIRMKIILISYLTQIPEYFGMPVWTPFLNFDIVKKTLNLPDSRRRNRIWQKDFFRKVGLNFEDMNLKCVKSNKLDYEIAKKADFEPIDIESLKQYIDEKGMIEINKILSNTSLFEKVKNQLLYVPKVGGLLRRLGFKNEFLKALYEYYVIKAIEKGLKYET